MTIADAIGWGTAVVAVVIAVALSVASTMAVLEHRRQRQRIAEAHALFSRTAERFMGDDPIHAYQYVRSLAREGGLYWSPPPSEKPPVAVNELARLRDAIGSVAVWELRKTVWYADAMAFVAAFDAGRRDARHVDGGFAE